MNISISAYYNYKSGNYKGTNKYNKQLETAIFEIFHKNKSQGHRKIYMVLKNKYELHTNKKTVLAYMNRMNLKVNRRKSEYSIPSGLKASKYYTNLLSRDFSASSRNQKWSIDITYVPYGERRCYLFCIKDLFDKSIVEYQVSENMSISFVINTIRKAIKNNNVQPNQLIIHSDQGIHFSNNSYHILLNKYGVYGSHSRRGNCLDNAPIESFFSLFKHEALWVDKPSTLEDAKNCINRYMKYYNTERYQIGLNEKTPYEIRFSV